MEGAFHVRHHQSAVLAVTDLKQLLKYDRL
jgi:hypothetical protein